MKLLLYVMLWLVTSIISTSVYSQEAKLVEYGKWGSAAHISHVELNGYYYLLTEANKVDVIDPSLVGEESIVTTIDMVEAAGFLDTQIIFSARLRVLNGKLVYQGSDRTKVFSVGDDHKLTLDHSLSFEHGQIRYSFTNNGKLHLFDKNKVYVVSEEGSQLNTVSYSTGIEFPYEYIPEVFYDEQFYFIILRQGQDGNEFIKKIYKYDNETHERLAVIKHSSSTWDLFSYIGNEQFIISNKEARSIVSIKGDVITEVTNIDEGQFGASYIFSLVDDELHAISMIGSRSFMDYYVYSLADSDNVALLSHQSLIPLLPGQESIGMITESSFDGNKWVGLSENYGLIQVELTGNSVSKLSPFWTHAGKVGKVAIIDNKLAVPRRSRVDFLDISTPEFQLESTSYVLAKDVFNHEEKLLTSSWYDVSSYTVNSERKLDLQDTYKKVDFPRYSSDYESLKTELHLFDVMLIGENWYVHRYELDNPNATPKEILLPFTGITCSNGMGMAILGSYLALVESCSQSVFLFSNYDTDEIDYHKRIEHSFAVNRFATKGEYLYFSGDRHIEVVKLNDKDALELVTNVALSNIALPNLTVLGDYLLLSNDIIQLYSLATASQPEFISETSVSEDLMTTSGEFQLTQSYISYTHEWGGVLALFKVNLAPVAVEDKLEMNEDTPQDISSLFKDPESDGFSYQLKKAPAKGEITVGESIVYTPTQDFFGSDEFVIKLEDVHGNYSEQKINVTIFSVNDAPVTESDTISVNHNSSVSNSVVSSDVDEDTLEHSIIDNVTNGTLSLSTSGEYTYTPNTGYSGVDLFTYQVSDGEAQVQGTITFNVKAATVTKEEDSSSGGGGSTGWVMVLVLFSISVLRKKHI